MQRLPPSEHPTSIERDWDVELVDVDAAKRLAREERALGVGDLDVAPADRATLRDFLESWVEHARPVLFVGAGMSRYQSVKRRGAPESAEIKDWGGLVTSLRARLAGGDQAVLARLPSDYLRIAQLHETQFQRTRLLDAVEEALAGAHFEPGPAHARLKRFQWEAIITTNYDELLERSFTSDRTRNVVKIVWDDDLTRRRPTGALLLVKMHGDVLDRDSIVITEEDYRCYEQSRPGVALKVRQLLLEHPSLFIGFSLSDPNVAAIEGWIRDTTGRLKLPSVVVVHSEPLNAERDMWARRGIKLVHLRNGETLVRFFDALYGERQRTARPNNAEQEPAGHRAVEQILEKRAGNWEAQAAMALLRLADGNHEVEFANAARYVLLGDFKNVPADSIKRILERLSDAERRVVLQRAHAHGILKAVAGGSVVLDIESELLERTRLSPTERAAVLIQRAKREQRTRDLQAARATLQLARSLQPDEGTCEQINRQLRSVLLQLGDATSIDEELLNSPLPENSFAYSRRGADALLTRGRAAATPWYTDALKYARDGDEKTSALLGLHACAEPGDWSEMRELEEQRRAIFKEERPRTEGVNALRAAAGEQLVATHSGAYKAHQGRPRAVDRLREALAEADDMGWPRSVRPNLITMSDGIAHAIVGLMIQEPSAAAAVHALELAIERGLFAAHHHFSPAILDLLATDSGAVDRVRELLRARDEATFTMRTRSLLRSALLPILPDSDIADHVIASVEVAEVMEDRLFEASPSERHWELLVRHQPAMPRAAALHMLKCIATIVGSTLNLPALRADWLFAPVAEWIKTGAVLRDDDALQGLVVQLRGLMQRDLVRKDPFVRLGVCRWITHLAQSNLFSNDESAAFSALLDTEIARVAVPAADSEPVTLLELIAARCQIAACPPSPAMFDAVRNHWSALKDSIVLCIWPCVLTALGPVLNQEEKRDVVLVLNRCVAAALKADMSARRSAEFLVYAAQAGIIDGADALGMLHSLGAKSPDVLPLAARLPAVNAIAEVDRTLVSLAVERDEGSLLEWCRARSAIGASQQLERIALGELHTRDKRARQLAYWCAGALATNGALSQPGRLLLAAAVRQFGAVDGDWHVRAAALAAAEQVLDCLDSPAASELVARASADTVAGVRRASDQLARALRSAETRK